MNPYGIASYKITLIEWVALKAQLDRTDPATHDGLYSTGQHRGLYNALTALGFNPDENAEDVYQMATTVVAYGWDE